MPAKGGDSKNGLIVALVICVLFVIGLGVATYYGYAGQEDLVAKEKAARAAEKTMKDSRNWYQFLAWQYKSYLGEANKNDYTELTELRKQYKDGLFSKADKNFAENDSAIKKLDERKDLGWDIGQHRPATSAKERMDALEGELRKAREKLDEAQKETKQALDAKRQAEDVAAQAAANYKKDLQNKQQEFVNLAAQRQKAFDDTREALAKESERLEEVRKKAQEAMEELQKKFAELEREKKEYENLYRRTLQEKTELAKENTRVRGQIDPVNPLEAGPARGKIVRLDRAGSIAWINLGSADSIKPQVRFSIFKDKGNGTATGEIKGSLQVTEVVGERLSKAQITQTRDPNRDPIGAGDLIYNPTWSPTAREHVAVAGRIDLTGLGTDNTAEFIRSLERQGIVVDAYLDLKELAIKGKGMSLETTYLIRGDDPQTAAPGAPGEVNRNRNVEEVNTKISQMTTEALKLGIQVVPFRRYMVLTGYRAPRGVAEAAPLGTRYTPPTDKKEKEPKEKDAPKKEPAKANGKAPPKDDGK